MTRQTVELRSWAFIAVSFLLGMMVAEFVDYCWQAQQDEATLVVSTQTEPGAARD